MTRISFAQWRPGLFRGVSVLWSEFLVALLRGDALFEYQT